MKPRGDPPRPRQRAGKAAARPPALDPRSVVSGTLGALSAPACVAMLAGPCGPGWSCRRRRCAHAAARELATEGSDTMTDTPAAEDREPTPAPEEPTEPQPTAAESDGDP